MMGFSCWSTQLVLPLAALLLASFATAERHAIESLNILLLPDTHHVQYMEVIVDAPGYVDLSYIKLATIDDGDANKANSMVDAMVVSKPPKSTCTDADPPSCWLIEAGVGKLGEDGHAHWCCTTEAEQAGLCEGQERHGRQILDITKFSVFGQHRFVEFPGNGKFSSHINDPKFDLPQSGTYGLLFANCNKKDGRDVVITGSVSAESPTAQAVQLASFRSPRAAPYQSTGRNQQTKQGFQINGAGIMILLVVLCVAGFLVVSWRTTPEDAQEGRGYDTLEFSDATLELSARC